MSKKYLALVSVVIAVTASVESVASSGGATPAPTAQLAPKKDPVKPAITDEQANAVLAMLGAVAKGKTGFDGLYHLLGEYEKGENNNAIEAAFLKLNKDQLETVHKVLKYRIDVIFSLDNPNAEEKAKLNNLESKIDSTLHPKDPLTAKG